MVENGEITKEFVKNNYLRKCLQELENFKIKIDNITTSEQIEQSEQGKQGKQTEQSDEFIESSKQREQSDEFIESSKQREQSDEFIERSKEDEDKKRTTLMI